jgi:hypothetical protein
MTSTQFQTFVNKASEEKRNYLHTYSSSRVNKNQLRQASNKNIMIECRHRAANWFEIDFRAQK